MASRIDVVAPSIMSSTYSGRENYSHTFPNCPPQVLQWFKTCFGIVMLQHHINNKISVEKIVEKMCHAPAICFKIKKRGFIREGYYADLVAIVKKSHGRITKGNLMYKCGWSPLENKRFDFNISHTFHNRIPSSDEQWHNK